MHKKCIITSSIISKLFGGYHEKKLDHDSYSFRLQFHKAPKFQAVTLKEIKERAHARHAEITRLGAIVEERREQEMAKSLEQRDATKMLKFEEQDHALNEHSQQLDRLIHGAWSMEDALRPKWIDLTKRIYGQ